MTRTKAIAAARKFVETYVDAGRQWNVASVEGCLPDGYELSNVEVGDFFPVTVENIARVIKAHAVRA